MPPPRDLTGMEIGRLTVLGLAGPDGQGRRLKWNCECLCGQRPPPIFGYALTRRRKPTRSCGCLQSETARGRATKLSRACRVCQAPFVGLAFQRYCSPKCRAANKLELAATKPLGRIGRPRLSDGAVEVRQVAADARQAKRVADRRRRAAYVTAQRAAGRTLADIAAELGVTKQRVQQIEAGKREGND